MARLIVSTAMTVDGVISVEGWYVPEGGHDRAGRELLAQAEAMLLGPKNYEGLAGYWAPETGEWADLINPMPKYVASRTLEAPLNWNATLMEGDLGEGVARLKAELGGDLITFGCGELTRALLDGGLVDELRFWVHSVLWGRGERPFGEEETIHVWLLGSETFDSGVTLLRYAPTAASEAAAS
jgi:dihydrofolate reductase